MMTCPFYRSSKSLDGTTIYLDDVAFAGMLSNGLSRNAEKWPHSRKILPSI